MYVVDICCRQGPAGTFVSCAISPTWPTLGAKPVAFVLDATSKIRFASNQLGAPILFKLSFS